MSRKSIIIGVILVVVVVAGILFWSNQKDTANPTTPSRTNHDTPATDTGTSSDDDTADASVKETSVIQRRTLTNFDFSDLYRFHFAPETDGKYDAKSATYSMFAQTQKSDWQLVLKDVKTLFPEIFNDFPNTAVELRIFDESLDHRTQIIEPYIPGTYKTTKSLYRFDTQTGTITKPTSTEFIFKSFDQMGYSNMAQSEGTRLWLMAPNPPEEKGLNQKLYLVDLFKDTATLFRTFEGTETLNAGSYQQPLFDIIPNGYRTIRVAIFENNLKNASYDPNKDKGKAIVKTYLDIEIPIQ